MEVRNLSRIAGAYPELKAFAEAVAKASPSNANWDYIAISEGYRSPAVQNAYYAQGREPLAVVNKMRADAGIRPITEAENAKTITNAIGGRGAHGVVTANWKGAAMDWYAYKNGKFYVGKDWYDLQREVIKKFPTLKMGLDFVGFSDPPHIEFKDYRKYLNNALDAANAPDEPESVPFRIEDYSAIKIGTAVFFLISFAILLYIKFYAK